MRKQTINLEEILKGQIVGDSNLSVHDLVTKNSGLDIAIKSAMLEFGKQLLKLAADNAKTEIISEFEVNVNKQSILDIINQVKS